MMAKPSTLALVDGLHVEIHGDDCDPERFVRAFALAWQALPASWQRRLWNHWRRPRRTKPRATGPRIRLQDKSLDIRRGKSRRSVASIACVDHRGDSFSFLAPVQARLPLRLAAGVIAHELGHAALEIEGVAGYFSESTEEMLADAMACAWGLPVIEIDAWLDDHVKRWQRGLPVWRA